MFKILDGLTFIINEGGLPNQVTHYNLDGNRLVSSGSLTGESALYQYYPDGNLKVDSKRNLQFGYNLLNLPQVVTSVGGGTHWARYAYLADGTKMYRKDMHHDGHIYRGSFVYRLEGGVQRLESIGYEEGRIMVTGHNDWGMAEEFIDTWHVTDHLGNVRAVVDITDSGESVEDVMSLVLEQNDYRPFGERIDDERMEADGENRYRFAGKEEQAFLDGVYSDFGARYHSSDIQRWTTPDPLSEKYYDLSPYAFCNNNPINFVDPDGSSITTTQLKDSTIIQYTWQMFNGKWQFVNNANNEAYQYGSDSYIDNLSAALYSLMENANGYLLVTTLAESKINLTIGKYKKNTFYPNQNSVGWNTTNINAIPTTDGINNNIPFISLSHELAHAYNKIINESSNNSCWYYSYDIEIAQDEIYAIHYENLIRKEHGFPLRTRYTIDGPRVIDKNRRSIYFNCQMETKYTRVAKSIRYKY